MFNTITTSRDNKELVTSLTNKLGLGTENVIARLALAHSLAKGRQLDVRRIKDAQGKAYSAKVLFGDYLEFYIALICQHYSLYKTDKDIPKYIKMHIDDGLESLQEYANSDGLDFLIAEIEKGLDQV
jgi:DNA sulfur modification protein DndE